MSERRALRAVVDTNLFISGLISPLGRPRLLLRAWYERRFELLISDPQHAELTDVLNRPKIIRNDRISPHELANFLTALALATRVIPILRVPLPVRDPKDEPILAAAVGSNADYLVTCDGDLLALRGAPLPGLLEIVTAAQFLAILDEQAGSES
jgi:putative PIN family toxin of toxin-antitoxin system